MRTALLLDFDGLIIDTETSVYDAWASVFVELGVEPIDRSTWVLGLGRPEAPRLLAVDRGIDVAIAVPAGLAAFDTHAVDHAVAAEKVLADAGGGIGAIAHVETAQLRGDTALDLEFGDRHLLGDGAEIALLPELDRWLFLAATTQ